MRFKPLNRSYCYTGGLSLQVLSSCCSGLVADIKKYIEPSLVPSSTQRFLQSSNYIPCGRNIIAHYLGARNADVFLAHRRTRLISFFLAYSLQSLILRSWHSRLFESSSSISQFEDKGSRPSRSPMSFKCRGQAHSYHPRVISDDGLYPGS